MLYETLLSFIIEEMEGRSSLETLDWGQEISRLPPAPYVIWDVYQNGVPEPLPSLEAPAPPPDGFVSTFLLEG